MPGIPIARPNLKRRIAIDSRTARLCLARKSPSFTRSRNALNPERALRPIRHHAESFKIGKEDVWMPVASVSKTHMEDDAKGLAIYTKEPTDLQTMSVIDRTMEFNKHPGPDVFTSKYKPGTPISDHLKKLQYKYGQDKLKPQPTRSEVEAMLNSQLAKAETQKNELVAAPFSEGVNWWAWSVSGLGAAVLASLTALWMQRRAS
jgi:hypothetical protein